VKTDIRPGAPAHTPRGASQAEDPPWGTSFLVDGQADQPITLAQLTASDFALRGTLSYVGDMGLDGKRYAAIDEAMRLDACHLDGSALGSSDLASVPRFLRWFENPYGRHTPAALIHDRLIEKTPNAGALHSDTASDRFFRYMLASSGVPVLERWIMWAAVALRTRCAVGGWRRVNVGAWVALSVAGIVAFVWALVALASGGAGPWGLNSWVLLGASLAAPVLAGLLWGRQWGASLITAVAAPFLLPPAAIAAVGYCVYRVLERLARLAPVRWPV
jgi:hypothetical protein